MTIRHYSALLAVGSALALAATASAQSPVDSASVRGFYAEWFGSLGQDPDAYARFYSRDGMVLPPNQPPATGRAAIAEWLRQSRVGTTYTTRPDGIVIDEMRFLTSDWVLHRSTLRGHRIPRAGGEALLFETKYVDLLRRTGDGRWEVVYRMWSDNR